MENSEGPRRIDSKAYRLFRSECMQHVQEIERILESETGLSKVQCDSGRIRCHTMKGGAGFFGLEELAKCAAMLEKLFAGRLNIKTAKEARTGLEELMRLIAKLPAPPNLP